MKQSVLCFVLISICVSCVFGEYIPGYLGAELFDSVEEAQSGISNNCGDCMFSRVTENLMLVIYRETGGLALTAIFFDGKCILVEGGFATSNISEAKEIYNTAVNFYRASLDRSDNKYRERQEGNFADCNRATYFESVARDFKYEIAIRFNIFQAKYSVTITIREI